MFQTIITDFFTKKEKELTEVRIEKDDQDVFINIEKTYGYNKETGYWHCIECGDNMGDNPRQLCGKSYCYNNIDNIY